MKLNQRITIQRRQAGQDGYGQETTAWTDVCTVWAEAEPLRGREQFLAQQTQVQADVRFVIRYRSDIDAAMRVLWRGQPHGIAAPPADIKAGRQWLEIMATSGGGDGG
jgi:SPP1 family predicted phage head-tail adaptor